jgi:hypothetical protein
MYRSELWLGMFCVHCDANLDANQPETLGLQRARQETLSRSNPVNQVRLEAV